MDTTPQPTPPNEPAPETSTAKPPAGRGKRVLKRIFTFFLLILLGIQFVPVERDNPEVLAGLEGPEHVKSILQRACYDCHSHETKWPWYSYVAPMSWLVSYDVVEGRKAFNFSTWGEMDEIDEFIARSTVIEAINDGEMPPEVYMPMHPEAKLSEEDLAILQQWADGEFDGWEEELETEEPTEVADEDNASASANGVQQASVTE